MPCREEIRVQFQISHDMVLLALLEWSLNTRLSPLYTGVYNPRKQIWNKIKHNKKIPKQISLSFSTNLISKSHIKWPLLFDFPSKDQCIASTKLLSPYDHHGILSVRIAPFSYTFCWTLYLLCINHAVHDCLSCLSLMTLPYFLVFIKP